MLIHPQLRNIGRFNYIKTTFLGKGFEIYSISKPRNSAEGGHENPVYEMSPEEKGMLSISDKFLILTYIKPDGKRRPVLVKTCSLTDNNSGADLLDVLGMETETNNYRYLDEDGWEWSLHINKSPYTKSIGGTGFIRISKDSKELYDIRLR